MSNSVNNTSGVIPSGLEQYTSQTDKSKKTELDQQAFLNLMVTQLKNQDPMKPLESADFLSQIAQFSTVSGISGLQKSLSSMASSLQSSQALQASTMVGRDVVIPRNSFSFSTGETAPISAALDARASNVTVTITDSAGQLVREEQLGAKNAGNVSYTWDGLGTNGLAAPTGTYKVKITANIDGTPTALTPAVRARVDSVTLGKNGLPPTLNVNGYGAVDMGDVMQIL